jgi:uncharacterized protein YcbK (DUF882 family)
MAGASRLDGPVVSPSAKLASVGCLIVAALLASQPSAEATAAPELEPDTLELRSRPLDTPELGADEDGPAPAPEAPRGLEARPHDPGRVLRLELLGTGRRAALAPFDGDGRLDEDVMLTMSALLAPNAQLGRKVVAPTPVDPRLAALLLEISEELGDAPIVVVSGHREPGRGTSRRSYHVRGMAADISAEGVRPIDVRAAAIRAGAGGVGLYPTFVHVDVREQPYRWGGGGRPKPLKR